MSDQQTATADSCASRVRAPYAAAARQAAAGTQASDSGCSCGQPVEEPGIGAELYTAADRDALPDAAVLASFGCGNPAAVAELHQGETVLDLGSGRHRRAAVGQARRADRQGMGSVGDAYDNAVTESFFATLECELLDRSRFVTPTQARTAVFDYLEGFYNPRRRHSTLGYLSPVEYERRHPTGHTIA